MTRSAGGPVDENYRIRRVVPRDLTSLVIIMV
jgi:hypothetical protein